MAYQSEAGASTGPVPGPVVRFGGVIDGAGNLDALQNRFQSDALRPADVVQRYMYSGR